jgi:hypothetical protein
MNFLLKNFVFFTFAALATYNVCQGSTQNFYHGFTHLDELGANLHLIEQTGIKRYSEWQNPPITYFGPSGNDQEGFLTYKFLFDGPTQDARVKISLSAWNFNVGGAYGSGTGEASAWASKDGSNWVNLIDLPTPSTSFSDGKTFEDMLPSSVLGSTEIYIQIRMKVSGAPNSSYTTAQFGRSDANANKDIFYLDANYSPPEVESLELSSLGRKDEADFGNFSNFASGFTLDGNRIAAWQETGNGVVNIWDISESGELSLTKSISSPDITHDKASFGASILLQDDFLGIGSQNTWKSSPHDGRFYIYDWQDGSKVSDFNPAPKSAGYFGVNSSISSDVFVVAESGAYHANFRNPSTHTFYTYDGFQHEQLFRDVQAGNGQPVSSEGDYFAATFREPIDSYHRDHVKLWKVVRDDLGKAIDVTLTDHLEIEKSDTNQYYGNSLIHGDLLFIGVRALVVDGISSGGVYIFRITAEDKLEFLQKTTPSNPVDGMRYGSAMVANRGHLFVGSSEAENGTLGTGKVTHYKINQDNSQC